MTVLAAPINDTTRTIRVDAGIANPSYPLFRTLDAETIKVTGGATTVSWQIERGVGDTTPAAHIAGTTLATDATPFGASEGGATPTLAEVLVEGNETGEPSIVLPMGTIDGTTEHGGIRIDGLPGAIGSPVSIAAGASSAGDGGATTIYGGSSLAGGENAGGASFAAEGGYTDGTGGAATAYGGNARSTGGDPGGDVILSPGLGDGAGRNGLVFLNLPTVDPEVAGGLWADNGVVTVSAG